MTRTAGPHTRLRMPSEARGGARRSARLVLGTSRRPTRRGRGDAHRAGTAQPCAARLARQLARTERDAALRASPPTASRRSPRRARPRDPPRGQAGDQPSRPVPQGWLRFRTRGSQLLAWLLAPRRGEMVADYCAGAGGKTLAAAMLMRGTGRVYAMDVSAKRLPRSRRAPRAPASPTCTRWCSGRERSARPPRREARSCAGRCALQRLRYAAAQSRPEMAARPAGHRRAITKQRAILAAARAW